MIRYSVESIHIYKNGSDNLLQNKRDRLIHLHRCRGLSRRKLFQLLQMDSSLSFIFSLSPNELKKYLSIEAKQSEFLYDDLHSHLLIHDVLVDKDRYSIVTILDNDFPIMLKSIQDPPLVLYAAGDIGIIKKMPSISVIGTRKPSNQGGVKTKFLIEPLIKKDWVIVSGMARGIDSYAHKLALYHQGKTIAILGSGFRHIYPKENKGLFHQIEKYGLVLSEYPPNTPPRKFHFPERNRIISGLSFGTLVIEATEKSGTLITVEQALDQGREVYAVPDAPHLPQSIGCLKLIQEGAKIALTYKDIQYDWDVQGMNWLNSAKMC